MGHGTHETHEAKVWRSTWLHKTLPSRDLHQCGENWLHNTCTLRISLSVEKSIGREVVSSNMVATQLCVHCIGQTPQPRPIIRPITPFTQILI